MLRIASTSFAAALFAAAWFVTTTTAGLGDPVATHFGPGNFANGWMSRDGYRTFMLVFTVLLPVLVVGTVGWLPRMMPARVSLPNPGYWLAAERRAATLDDIAARACILGCAIAAFVGGVHALVLEANAAVPPRLPGDGFAVLLVAFLAAFALWLGAFWWHYRRAPR
jgi:hypothetical protein